LVIVLPGAESLYDCYWQWYGCPHCQDPEEEDYGFTFHPCDMFDEYARDRGAYCGGCKSFISLEDAKEWLERNDPTTLGHIRFDCESTCREVEEARHRSIARKAKLRQKKKFLQIFRKIGRF